MVAPMAARGLPVSMAVLLLSSAHGVTVPTKISRRRALVATISVGTPPQQLRCLLDSGSADLWVPSMRCESCRNKHHFLANMSSTFVPKTEQTLLGMHPKRVTVSYGSGQIAGFDVQDTLRFGSFEVENQSFVIVEDAALPKGRSWDGICGLAWAGLSRSSGRTLYQRMQDKDRQAVFSLVPTGPGEAYLAVGKLPEGAYKPDTLVWTEAQALDPESGSNSGKHSFWVVSGGLAITRKKPAQMRFLVDTGTNQALLVPPMYYQSVVKSLLPDKSFTRFCNSRGGMVFCDCGIVDEELPPLRIYLGGRTFSLTIPELFAKVPPKGTPEDASDDNPLCVLQIRPNPMAGGPLGPMGGLLGGLLGGLFGPPDAQRPPPPPPQMPGGPPQMPGAPPQMPGGPPPMPGLLGGLLGGLTGRPGAGGSGAGAGPGTAPAPPFVQPPPPPQGVMGGDPLMPPMVGLPPRGNPFGQPGSTGTASSSSSRSTAGGSSSSSSVAGILGGLLGPGQQPANATGPGKILGELLGSSATATTETSAHGKIQSETRIVTRTMPDGSLCTTTLMIKDGKVQKNQTDCKSSKAAEPAEPETKPAEVKVKAGNAHSADSYNYLQDVENPDVWMGSPEDARAAALGSLLGRSPLDDLWVLGGVFLERYVVCLDFDKARVGFAEPAVEIEPKVQEIGLFQEVPIVEGDLPTRTWTTPASLTAWSLASTGVLLAGVASLAAWRSHLRRETLLGRSSASDLEAVE